MTIVGLTGSFGTGKTFVASCFKELGASIIDADRLARKVLKKGSSTYERIIDAFGESILDKKSDIDRRRLAKMVFAKRSSLKRLNEIVHPEVIREIKKKISKKEESEGVIIIDAPLLIEAGLAGCVDKLIVVKASRGNQVTRCMKKFRIEEDDVVKRIENQIPLARKVAIADFVIDNDGTKSETRRQVEKIWKNISRNII